jgi:hypothetical protein
MSAIECYQQRKFVKQPSSIPVEIEVPESKQLKIPEIHDESCHGLIIKRSEKLEINQILNIKIKIDQINFKGEGVVAFCNKMKSGYEIGIEFIKSCDPFEIKMTLQVCQIKDFLETRQQQESFTENEKALNWVKLNASTF